MKRFYLSTILAVLISIVQLNAQGSNPAPTEVGVDIIEVTPFTIECSFTKGSDVAYYHILASTDQEMQMWVQQSGRTIDELVVAWGKKHSSNTTNTWKSLVPNTPYIIYVVAFKADNSKILPYQTKDCPTLSNGGNGIAKQTITVKDITETTARVIVEPNAETSVYYYLMATDSLIQHIGIDSLAQIAIADNYPLYKKNEWIWPDLKQNTKYHIASIGKNALDQWGEVASTTFKTLAPTSIEYIYNSPEMSIYPIPNNGKFTIKLNNNEINGIIEIIDVNGKKVLSQKATTSQIDININNTKKGLYIVRYISDRTIISKHIIIK